MEARTVTYGDIGWAVNHVRHGHKMRRTPWAAGTYVALDTSEGKPGIIRLFTATQPDQMWHNTNADVLADDWVMAEPTLPGSYSAP